ncbi:chemotaxis-specific protein-glutamate methyltransferase CheB [Paractinoplanes tereljensis]|uniref:chemotaxis-specific protein-glutamate methyltransferase CheB n=1 Tax=Paractinoplanes tereljensis TaxID=571912 RepID=UPI003397429A
MVDDSAVMRQAIKAMLVDEFDVHTARNGLDALHKLEQLQPDVITLDVHMPVMDGLTCLARIMDLRPTPVVMVSALTERNALVTLEALALGAIDHVVKPGGTVPPNLDEVAGELVSKVRAAASARLGHQPSGRTPEAPQPNRDAVPRGAIELLLIGSSTGGPQLLTELLPQLPAGLGAPVVVAQHIPGSFTATLARRLDESCALRVHEVDRIMKVRRGHVYLGRGSADVVVARRADGLIVKSVPSGADYSWHPSVDRLVASARRHCDPARLVCVLLTGMGDDGAAEITEVHAAGGRTIAEAEETAVVWGMPGALARLGGASEVLPSYAIAGRLADWVR